MELDIEGNIHALSLILIAVSSVSVLYFKKKRLSLGQFFIGALVAFIMAAVGVFHSMHMCGAGSPFMQWVIPATSLFMIVTFVDKSEKIKKPLVGGIFAAGIVLCFHYVSVVHSESYTGNPSWVRKISEHKAQMKLKEIQSVLLWQKLQNKISFFPEGWLSDNARQVNIEIAELPQGKKVVRLWHTEVTGLYKVIRISQDYWYPGGEFSNIEIRVRE